MNFQVLLVVFAVVIATNIQCQAKPQLGDSDKSPGSVTFKQQGKKCNCIGRKNALVQNNCPCEPQRQNKSLSKEQRDICQKKGILTYKLCQKLTARYRKKEDKISTPF